MFDEREYLRDIAHKISENAGRPEQSEKTAVIKSCNNLNPARPVVFARPENGWPDLHEQWGPHCCEDERHKEIEDYLLKELIRGERIQDDMPVLSELRVPMRISGNTYDDFGLNMEVADTNGPEQGAYHIEAALQSWNDMTKLHYRKPAVDREGSRKDLIYAQELLGDILDVWQPGITDWRYGHTRVLIHMRGFQQFLFDFYDSPGELHEIMEFFSESFRQEIDYYQREGLISPNTLNNDYIGVGGPCATDQLAGRDTEGPLGPKDCVVWAEAQETVGVSTTQFEEFVFKYQKPLIERFGLSGYGCCEGLESRFDLLKEGLSNLRWIAVSPWADAEKMADQIGKDYVYLYKVNPSLVVSPDPDWKAAEDELRRIHEITDGMAVQFSLKDTTSFCGEPERIRRWVNMALEIAAS